jgi:hypothetical protein
LTFTEILSNSLRIRKQYHYLLIPLCMWQPRIFCTLSLVDLEIEFVLGNDIDVLSRLPDFIVDFELWSYAPWVDLSIKWLTLYVLRLSLNWIFCRGNYLEPEMEFETRTSRIKHGSVAIRRKKILKCILIYAILCHLFFISCMYSVVKDFLSTSPSLLTYVDSQLKLCFLFSFMQEPCVNEGEFSGRHCWSN